LSVRATVKPAARSLASRTRDSHCPHAPPHVSLSTARLGSEAKADFFTPHSRLRRALCFSPSGPTRARHPALFVVDAASSHPHHLPDTPWSISNGVVLVLCSQRRVEDRSGTPAAFNVLHRRARHHERATSSTEPPDRHLLQHPVGILFLTDISSDASDLPSGLPPLNT
jgi:hypothetical protein